MSGALLIVGIGPGDPHHMTGRALEALAAADIVIGYSGYIDLLRPVLPGLDYRPSAITQENLRARTAVELALGGKRVALVGSGDAGIYGLAGLAFEHLEARDAAHLPVEVVPGVTAALSAAALLGAPLGHDFACISLSDLLTPWETIRDRLEAAAAADFAIALYNPKSSKRERQFAEACAILQRYRLPETPVGIVRNAFRAGQEVALARLAELPKARVDMLTTVIIGNRSTRRWRTWLITPRGYRPVTHQPFSASTTTPRIRDDAPNEPFARHASEPMAPAACDEAGIGQRGAYAWRGDVGASTGDERSDIVLLVGHGTRDVDGLSQYHAFAEALARVSGERIVPACLELNDPDIPTALARCIAGGARHVTVLPLLLGTATHHKNDIPTAIAWARSRYPHVRFSYGTPLGAHAGIAEALAARAEEAIATIPELPPSETALLLVGRGSSDPDSNADLFKTGRLLHECHEWGWVECCYIAMARPDLPEGIERCVRLGARRIILVPHMLFTGVLDRRIDRIADEMRQRHPSTEIVRAAPLGAHPRVLEVALQRIAEARTGDARANCDACRYRVRMTSFETDLGRPQTSDAAHGLRGTGVVVAPVPHQHGVSPTLRRQNTGANGHTD